MSHSVSGGAGALLVHGDMTSGYLKDTPQCVGVTFLEQGILAGSCAANCAGVETATHHGDGHRCPRRRTIVPGQPRSHRRRRVRREIGRRKRSWDVVGRLR